MAGLFGDGPLGLAAVSAVGSFTGSLQSSGKLPAGPLPEYAAAALGYNFGKTGGAEPEPYLGGGVGIVQQPRSAGFIAWVKSHPILSAVIALGGVLLLWKVLK